MYKFGLLLPRSDYYTTIGFDLFDGLKHGLHFLQRKDITVVCDNIGFGTEHQNCYRAVEKMLMQDDVSIVFAYISHRTAQLLRPLFLASNKLLVILDSGANLNQEWPQSPNLFYISLNNSLGNMLAIESAVKSGKNKTGVVTGYYDGGYLQTFAASHGCSTFNSEIVFNHATGYKRESFTMEPLKSFVEAYPNSHIHGIFSGDFVQWFFEDLNIHFPDKNLTITLPPFALEESMLKEAEFPGVQTYGIASWSEKLPINENQKFIESLSSKGKNVNLFSLLGWEAALIANHLTTLLEEQKYNGRKVGEALLNFRYVGPRGETYFHKPTQTTLSPMYSTTIIETENGKCALGELNELPSEFILSSFESLVKQPLNNAISGWYNSYVCI